MTLKRKSSSSITSSNSSATPKSIITSKHASFLQAARTDVLVNQLPVSCFCEKKYPSNSFSTGLDPHLSQIFKEIDPDSNKYNDHYENFHDLEGVSKSSQFSSRNSSVYSELVLNEIRTVVEFTSPFYSFKSSESLVHVFLKRTVNISTDVLVR